MDKKLKNNSVSWITKITTTFFVLICFVIYLIYAETLDKVEEFINKKEFDKALQILEKNKQKFALDYYLNLAYIYAYTDKDYDKILREAKQIFVDKIQDKSTKDKNFSKILFGYGYIHYYVKNDIYSSEIFLRKSLEYDQNNDKASITLAQLYYDKGETDKSEELLDKTFDLLKNKNALTSDFIKIYSQVLMENRRYSKVVQILEPYIEKYDIAKLFYAKALTFKSEYLKANQIIKQFLNKNNDNLEAYYILGLTYKDSRIKSTEGIEIINSLNPEKNDRYYLKLAQFYEGLGDIELAINYYDKALAINKNNEKYYILAITYAIDVGQTSRAINWAFEYYTKKPNDFNANLFLAMCYEGQKQFENAKKYYQQAINIDPSRYEPYVRMAWIVLEQEADFNTSAQILLDGYQNVKDLYYKRRFKISLKQIVELEEEFKKKYKQKTNQDISKPIKPELKEKIMKIIKEE
ncbi:MAG: tetratricopeptide repeat protein [bacterium]